MLTANDAFTTVTKWAERLRRHEVTSVELTQFYLDRLERLGPQFNAVVTVTRDLALEQAKLADRDFAAGRDHGPLHGIPYGVKDLLATRGIPTSWGSGPLREQVFDYDATVIERLREAGAVLAAKLSMVELAGGFGYRQANASFTGPGRNGWNRERWAGGSSSGPGSAVAAGLVPFAIGSETSGSIMTPAGYNGLTGLRPTYGRVSRHGAMALSWTLDKLGPMTRTAEDAGLVLGVIAGPDVRDPTSLDEPYTFTPEKFGDGRRRLAIVAKSLDNVQPEVRANFEQACQDLADLATFEEITLPDLPYSAVVGTIISCEMAAAFEDFIRDGRVWGLAAPEDQYGGHSTLAIPAKDYINALRIRAKIQVALDALFERFDAIVTPTLNTVAGPIDRDFRDWAKGFSSTSLGVAGNAAGLPGVTVCNGFGADDLPTAMQFVGRALDENRLLGLAIAYQQRTRWHERHPIVD